MEPIKISVKDNFKYTQIAFLVDREDFRNDVLEYRKKFNAKWQGIKIPFLPKEFESWLKLLKQKGITEDELLRGSKLAKQMSSEARQLLQENKKTEAKKAIKVLDLLFRQWQDLDFKKDINNLLRRYKVPSTCFKATARAVLCGEIEDSDWSYCEAILEPSDIKPEEIVPSRFLSEPNCYIKLTPYLTNTELTNAFDSVKDEVIKLYKKSPYGYKIYGKDTISNIKRDREWYWANKNGLSYAKIWKEMEKELGFSDDYIAKAIQRYKKGLSN